jgi:glycerol-3-phosphate dehydrogenase
VPRAERRETLSAARVREMEPALARLGLRGGATYYDAWGDDARLTLENALDASLHGAAVANGTAAEGFSKSSGRLRAAALRDRVSGRTFELRARVFVNAAGPWVDAVRRLDDPAVPPCVRLSKGVHVVLPRTALPVSDWMVLSDAAARLVFVMPHERYVVVGTTDTDYHADTGAVAADETDLSYLLGVLGESLPGMKLTREDIASSFAGLRALVLDGEGSRAPSTVSREEVILESASGLLTVAGGKLTTHREIAEKLVTRVTRELNHPTTGCATAVTPLPGARYGEPSGGDSEALDALPRTTRETLAARYGSRALLPARLAAADRALAAPIASGCPVVGAEVIHAVRNEMALTLADFMVRRIGAVWRWPLEAEAAAPAVARLMAGELRWNQQRCDGELAEFKEDLRQRRLSR